MSEFTFAERLKISQDNPLGIGKVDKDAEIAKLRAENERLANESIRIAAQAKMFHDGRDRYRQALEKVVDRMRKWQLESQRLGETHQGQLYEVLCRWVESVEEAQAALKEGK